MIDCVYTCLWVHVSSSMWQHQNVVHKIKNRQKPKRVQTSLVVPPGLNVHKLTACNVYTNSWCPYVFTSALWTRWHGSVRMCVCAHMCYIFSTAACTLNKTCFVIPMMWALSYKQSNTTVVYNHFTVSHIYYNTHTLTYTASLLFLYKIMWRNEQWQ